jgi:hypothetical protein
MWEMFMIPCCFLQVASSLLQTPGHENILNNEASFLANLTLEIVQEPGYGTGQHFNLEEDSDIHTEKRPLNTFKIDYENDTFVMNGKPFR